MAAYCFPYIVSLMPKTPYLEVHSWQDPAQALVQRIPVEKGASCLCDSIFGTDQEAKGRNPVRDVLRSRCQVVCTAPCCHV